MAVSPELCLQLSLLLLQIAPRALRIYFNKEIHPSKLRTVLYQNYDKLLALKRRRIINDNDWFILFPNDGSHISSEMFSFPLMICLLRNLINVKIQEHALPSPKLLKDREKDKGTDLSILKICYNSVVHRNIMEMSKEEYGEIWNLACQAVTRLGGLSFFEECNQLENVQFVKENKEFMDKCALNNEHRKKEINFLQLCSVCLVVVRLVIKDIFIERFGTDNITMIFDPGEISKILKERKLSMKVRNELETIFYSGSSTNKVNWELMLALLELFHEETRPHLKIIKRYCYEIFHMPNGLCTDEEFNAKIGRIENAIEELSGIDCSNFRTLSFVYKDPLETEEKVQSGENWLKKIESKSDALRHMQLKGGPVPSTSVREIRRTPTDELDCSAAVKPLEISSIQQPEDPEMFDFMIMAHRSKRKLSTDKPLLSEMIYKRHKKDSSVMISTPTVQQRRPKRVSEKAKCLEDENTLFKTRKDFEKNNFYKTDLCCDGMIVDCILPAACQDRHTLLKEGLPGMKTYNRVPETCTNFEELLYISLKRETLNNSIIFKESLRNSARKNTDLVSWFLVQNTKAGWKVKILSDVLNYALTMKSFKTAEILSCHLTKCIYNYNKEILSSVSAFWIGLECNCNKTDKLYLKLPCPSLEPKFIIEAKSGVDISKINLQDSTLKMKLIMLDHEYTSEAKTVAIEMVKEFGGQIIDNNSCRSDIANGLFNKHSNLTIVCPSKIRSVGFKSIEHNMEKEDCIQLFCRVKGVIPVGENHFDTFIKGMPTDVLQAVPSLSTSIVRVGDAIGSSGSLGTVGGFVKMYGFDTLLTCAHVVFNEDILLNGDIMKLHENHHEIFHYSPQSVSGCRVIQHNFLYGNPSDVSIDAALVMLPPTVPGTPTQFISKDDMCCGHTLNFHALGMSSAYLNNSFYEFEENNTFPNVHCISIGAKTGTQETKLPTIYRPLFPTDIYLKKPPDTMQQNQPNPVYQPSIPLNTQQQIKHQVPQTTQSHVSICPTTVTPVAALPQSQQPAIHPMSSQQQSVQPQTSSFSSQLFPVTLLSDVHVRAYIETLERRGFINRPTVKMFKQCCILNFAFNAGDSGTCIYTEKGCIAMAIADFPNGCIATPIRSILKSFKLI